MPAGFFETYLLMHSWCNPQSLLITTHPSACLTNIRLCFLSSEAHYYVGCVLKLPIYDWGQDLHILHVLDPSPQVHMHPSLDGKSRKQVRLLRSVLLDMFYFQTYSKTSKCRPEFHEVDPSRGLKAQSSLRWESGTLWDSRSFLIHTHIYLWLLHSAIGKRHKRPTWSDFRIAGLRYRQCDYAPKNMRAC